MTIGGTVRHGQMAMTIRGFLVTVGAGLAMLTQTASAEQTRPMPRPEFAEQVPGPEAEAQQLPSDIVTTSATKAAPPANPATASPAALGPRLPSRGAVTNLPLPRFVSLKTNEGNARRGPGLTHRIDWLFTKTGMPLRITAEYENWRRVEDADGFGGWVHYSLLSGVRTVLVKGDLVDFHVTPRPDSSLAFRAEGGVVGRVMTCDGTWCRINIDGQKGWVPMAALWGVVDGEVIE